MFTRYVTFIFLVGLSALFFTSGRSAPIDAKPAAATETVDLDTIDGASFGGYHQKGSVMRTALGDGPIAHAEPKVPIRDQRR